VSAGKGAEKSNPRPPSQIKKPSLERISIAFLAIRMENLMEK
jgi:hypothetical protein